MSDSKALTVRNNDQVAIARAAPAPHSMTPATLEQAMNLSELLSKSDLVPPALRGKPANVLLILMSGHELGLSPTKSLRGIDVVEGKPRISSELAVGLVLDSGLAEYFMLVSSDEKAAVYTTKRRGAPQPTQLRYAIEDAQRAGLAGKNNWKSHPAAMLRHRASNALAHAVYPDVLFGLGDPDDGADDAGTIPATVAPILVTSAVLEDPRAAAARQEKKDREAAAIKKMEQERAERVQAAAATRAAADAAAAAVMKPDPDNWGKPPAPKYQEADFPMGESAEPRPNSPEDVGFRQPAPAPAELDTSTPMGEVEAQEYAIAGAVTPGEVEKVVAGIRVAHDKGLLSLTEFETLRNKAVTKYRALKGT